MKGLYKIEEKSFFLKTKDGKYYSWVRKGITDDKDVATTYFNKVSALNDLQKLDKDFVKKNSFKVVQEDNGFGPGMMFGIPGPGPKKDTSGIPSDKKKEKGIDPRKMKNIPTFESFVNGFINEKKNIEGLVDMLINSMEHYDEKSFIDTTKSYGFTDKNQMVKLYDEYWKVSAKDRNDWDFAEWENFVHKIVKN